MTGTAAAGRSLHKTDVLVVFAAAWVAAIVYRAIWPLVPGRDFETYVWYYVEMWHAQPVMPFLMVYRTPLTPLFIGGLTELGGMAALTIAMNTCYAIAVAATYCIGAFWSRPVGWASAGVTLAYVAFGALYREVSSDVLFGTAFLAWCAWIAWTHDRLTIRSYIVHAAWVVLLTLIRPASQAFIVFALFPWIVGLGDTRTRLRCAGAFAAAMVVMLGLYGTYNAVRYQDFTIARGGNAINLFYRAFVTAKIVREENGPASRELAHAVREDLLKRDPYAAYGVTDRMFFEDGDSRGWSDLLALSDRVWGWPARYAVLRNAGIEAVVAKPQPFVAGVAHDALATLGIIGYPPPITIAAPPPPAPPKPSPPGLPVPTEGQRVPFSYAFWLASSPTGQIHSGEIATRPRFERIVAAIPPKPGLPGIANLLEKGQKMFPVPAAWLALGLLGTIRLGGLQRRVFYMLIAMAWIAPMAGVVGQGLVYHYRLPADPLFLAFGVAGFWRLGLGRTAPTTS